MVFGPTLPKRYFTGHSSFNCTFSKREKRFLLEEIEVAASLLRNSIVLGGYVNVYVLMNNLRNGSEGLWDD